MKRRNAISSLSAKKVLKGKEEKSWILLLI